MVPRYRVYLKVARACRTPFVFCLDRWYKPQSLESVKPFSITPWEYRAEVSDCDDAAFAFKGKYGHGVGIACSFAHCWNVVLCDEVWHIEPQNGAMFSVSAYQSGNGTWYTEGSDATTAASGTGSMQS